MATDRLQQIVRGGLDPDRDTNRDPRPTGGAEHFGQRAFGGVSKQIPYRQLQASPGKWVPFVFRNPPAELPRSSERTLEQRRDEEIRQDVPGRVGCLIRIAGIASGDALPPPRQTLTLELDDQAIPVDLNPEGGDERTFQSHPDMSEGDGVDSQIHPRVP